MNSKFKKAIAVYESQCAKALDRLIAKIQPDLQQACDEWGFDFSAGMGSWSINYGGKYARQKYKKLTSEYHLMGDPRWVLDHLEPDLADVLETSIERQPLGSLLNDVQTSRDNYEWVVIQADAWCLDKETEIKPAIITEIDYLDPDYAYFGWIPRQIAEAVINEYNRDWDKSSQLLGSLPDFIEQDLTDNPLVA